MNFNLLWHHDIDPDAFDDMMPFEREIYIDMIIKKVTEENEKQKQLASARRARASKRQ